MPYLIKHLAALPSICNRSFRSYSKTERRQVFLKRSLGTKDRKQANNSVKPELIDLDRIIGEAEALLKEQPVVAIFSDTQIKRMAEGYNATLLADDEEELREGTGIEPVVHKIAKELIEPASHKRHHLQWALFLGRAVRSGDWLLPATSAAGKHPSQHTIVSEHVLADTSDPRSTWWPGER